MTLKENKQRTSPSDVCNGKHFLLLYPRTSMSGTSGGSVLFDLPELKELLCPWQAGGEAPAQGIRQDIPVSSLLVFLPFLFAVKEELSSMGS